MINRRSTPSGDGRGRGRTGGSGRGGRPAFRSDDTRGGARGGFRRDDDDSRGTGGGPRRDGGFRDGGFRDGGFRDGGFRDSSSRDSLRADRGGVRARYGGRRDGENDGRSSRDERFAGREGRSTGRGDRSDDRSTRFGDRGDRGTRSVDRGERGAGFGDRGERNDRFGERGDRFGGRGDRFGGSGDRGGRFGGGGDREDRFGARSGRPARDDRFGGRGDRPARDDRFGGRSDRPARDDRFGGRSDRPARDDRYGRGERHERPARAEDRGGYRPQTRDDYRDGGRDDRAGGFRAGRSGRREDAAPRAASSTRSRYGKRDGDARQPGAGGDRRTSRAPRRDDVQTIGGGARRGGTGSQGYSSPQHSRVKAARQPIRDRDLFPEGYTDERDTTEVPGGVRLQKVLAQAGVASRRACEEMIGEGRVTVNGQVVRRFGAKVDPATQIIHVDGKRIPTAPDLVYYALNKPIGVVSTMDDPQGRPCLADYVEELAPRLFHVGRLDTETEGLLLLTNDGELANRLTHPSYGVQKKYWAKVPGPIPRDLGRRLKQGIELEDGIVKADSFSIVQEHGQQALVEVVLHEGRKHVVRRMLEEAGHRVIDLARIEFGPVKLGRTKPGTVRALTLKEVGELYAAVKL
ncbi:pseudouridine synthase [Nonomuraea gerenzanensis]|uniref:Pseudouridine synthase n=1 Tax=Nonomuraea gerenzanensis TaxID=93944 RepID=A0A1M4E7L6_9ACTN|nr:pseudouridine synthase [Nonomuraea gerenzanensis]UBU17040.1 pseudouridine synthase [Nonomuraea gerenzanensis]SBO94772.1 Ribosomal large subunit pseudouridine synthase B [Nonomuraea gerenzanensis]